MGTSPLHPLRSVILLLTCCPSLTALSYRITSFLSILFKIGQHSLTLKQTFYTSVQNELQLGQFNGYFYTLTDNLNKILNYAAKYLDQFAKNCARSSRIFYCKNPQVFVNKIQPILKEKMHESLQAEDHKLTCRASADIGSLPYINNDYHLRMSIT